MDKLRNSIAVYLGHHQICVLDLSGVPAAEDVVMPVRYRLMTATQDRELAIECLVPRWADMAYYLEQERTVSLIILACYVTGLRWLRYRGVSRPLVAPDWSVWLLDRRTMAPPDELYLVVRVTPERISLFDESLGWGVRETLEISPSRSGRP